MPVNETTTVVDVGCRKFVGGCLVFFPERVELCAIDICSGPRTGRLRATLELLRETTCGGICRGYSCEELALKLDLGHGDKVPGLIRQLRQRICDALMRAGITCGFEDVILSGGPGYRLSECVSVQVAPPAVFTDITDTDGSANVCIGNVRDVRDVEAEKRRSWILGQLAAGVRLKAPQVADNFKRSKKTAQRDLDALRDEGKIEFVGDPRTGFYRLFPPKG